MGGIEAALAEHAFEHLFIECLGWDRFCPSITVGVSETQMELTGVAQKRGFAVFVCPSHRTVLANRGLLRDVQRQADSTVLSRTHPDPHLRNAPKTGLAMGHHNSQREPHPAPRTSLLL